MADLFTTSTVGKLFMQMCIELFRTFSSESREETHSEFTEKFRAAALSLPKALSREATALSQGTVTKPLTEGKRCRY